MLKKSQSVELPLFYKELHELFLKSAQAKGIEQGPSVSEEEFFPLDQIVEHYQQICNAKGPIHVEKTLMEAFSPNDFLELGLARYYPKVYRGLPRVYHRDHPLESEIKKNFTDLPSLKKQALCKSLFSLYGKLPVTGKVTLFTWVMDDGMGDFVAATEVMRLIKARLCDLDIQMLAFIPEKLAKKVHFPEKSVIIPYKGEAPLITMDAFFLLAESDLILQLPTFYPYTNLLKEALPHVRWEMVGEYGFVESSWFHPQSGRYSLGLHFLEKGVLTRKSVFANWDDVQNDKLKAWRDPQNRFYLAYLSTPVGGAIYLHSLLKSLENDPLNVDVCTPDLSWFIDFIEKQTKAGKPILEWDVGISSIEVYFDNKFCLLPIAQHGKKLRLLCPGAISQSDFRALLVLSGEWVAIRGNQSFSEAVSQKKAFFYDGREHARYFLKDLCAIAENRIGSFPMTLECIRGIFQGFLYNVSVQEDTWVDETHFQELEDWTAIALKIGMALQNPEAQFGFKRLNSIIADEFSANSFLCHLVQRALFHVKHPYVEQLELANVEMFAHNEMSFKELIQTQKALIDACQSNEVE